jgi:hypothetical protein
MTTRNNRLEQLEAARTEILSWMLIGIGGFIAIAWVLL